MEERLKDLILNLTKDFEKTIPTEESEGTEIITAFKEHLYFSATTILEANSEFIEKDFEFIKEILIETSKDLTNLSLEEKKQELLIDEKFEQIRQISALAFTNAQNILNGKGATLDFEILDKIEEMQELLKLVKDYNKEQAKNLVSEAALDFEFINSRNDKALSLRLSHIKKYIEGDER